jgi:teichoic acid transport system ATP-binding protein
MSNLNEIVIDIKGLGVTYDKQAKKDDYKSIIINKVKRNEKKDQNRIIWPLRDVSFQGYQGEVLGIVGSNGSGKTTLCKTLTGLLHPDEGTMKVDGKVSALFSLGMGFNRKLSGRENVYLNGMMIGMEKQKIDSIIDQVHEFSGLGEFFDLPMKKYSSGMRARLGFSVASHLEPEILILDESLNTGDIVFARKAAQKIKELVKKAKMVILVTHSHQFARKHCDRVIWLEKGEIREVGDPDTVISHYEASVPRAKRTLRKRLNLTQVESQAKQQVIIEANNLGINYSTRKYDHWALKNLDFKIYEGEVVGIIGNNGAGKSTLCRTLTHILKPDEGNITVNGRTTALLNYGTGFNRQLSAVDNIYLNGMLLGIPKDIVERNINDILEFAELKHVKNKSIKNYSSGMRARLGFSIAAILQPDIFIIDEALSTGDFAFQEKASAKIQDMMEQAKAVIIVSHSMRFVETVCSRAIWIEEGSIVKDGEAKEVVAQYREKTKEKKRRMNR